MKKITSHLFGWALAAGVVGGILAFAIESSHAVWGPIDMNAVGGVLLALAVVLAVAAAITLVGQLNRSE